MADSSTQPLTDAQLAERLKTLQAKLERIASLRRRVRLVSSIGMLALIGLLAIFAYRLYSHFNNYRLIALDEQRREVFAQELWQKAELGPILDQERMLFATQVEAAVPLFRDKLMVAFDNRRPEIESELQASAERLKVHAQTHVETRLAAVMESSLERNEKELKAVFKNYDADKLKASMEHGKAIYIEELHDLIEEKYAQINPAMEAFMSRARALQADQQLDKATTEQLQHDITETLIDLIVFEIKPEYGELPASMPLPGANPVKPMSEEAP